MSSTTIKVNTGDINKAAQYIEGYIEEYKGSYEKVYSICAEVDAKWDGTDNDKYKSRLEEFRNDFQDLEKKLEDYVDFLRTAVREYEEAQSKLASQASKLAADR